MKNLRTYGKPPFKIAVLHGGPGAPGEMRPVAEELSNKVGVLEPLQTSDSINGQIEELRRALEENAVLPITLIGYSWGAWLGYFLAAKYPQLVKKLILVSSGPFKEHYMNGALSLQLSRLTPSEQNKVKKILKLLENDQGDNKLVQEFGSLTDKADSYDPLPNQQKGEFRFQSEIFEKVWPEAAEIRRSGELLELAKLIKCPVVAIHGDYDPHPAEGVQVPLSATLESFKFILLEYCGHTPWREKQAKDKFYEILQKELKS